MLKKLLTILGFQLIGLSVFCQQETSDTSFIPTDLSGIDTIDYDELFRDLDSFLDSIARPQSYMMASMSVSKGYFNFKSKTNILLDVAQKFTYLPTLAYYHKSGLGISGTGYVVNDEENLNFYQAGITPSFDHMRNMDFAAGISYTRFFSKDSIPFYTSPLQNEVYGYFTYRRSWIRPTVALSYGWGSRTDYEKREELITSMQLRRSGYIRVTKESISDFSLLTSIRHDFYWLDVFSFNDHIRFTPQVTFTSGTQKFGFNQASSSWVRVANNVLFNSENIYLDDKLQFQPLSLAVFLRGEYSLGKFFLQPQVMFDYYFPAPEKNFSAFITATAGFMF